MKRRGKIIATVIIWIIVTAIIFLFHMKGDDAIAMVLLGGCSTFFVWH